MKVIKQLIEFFNKMKMFGDPVSILRHRLNENKLFIVLKYTLAHTNWKK